MNRKQELLNIIGSDNNLLLPMVDQVIFMEKKLNDLEGLPFYKVHPTDPSRQKVLPAFKIYKETLQQYANCIKVLARAAGLDDTEEESPLRQWANEVLAKRKE